MNNPYLQSILTSRVYDVLDETPLVEANGLSNRLKNKILLKREDVSPVFSFKLRGAYNKIAKLPDDVKARGVVTASAGNHAQGVAYAAKRLGIKATIFMPNTAPEIKVSAVASYGVDILHSGDTTDDALRAAQEFCLQAGSTFVHPFDDPDVIAGQGTVGFEILKQHSNALHAIFVPIGGGGLIAGIASYVKMIRPEILIIGVEPEDSSAMARSLLEGRRVELESVGIFADGVAVKQIGLENYQQAKDLIDDVVVVETDAICAAIKDIYEDTRTIAEPAGALAVAGIKQYLAANAITGKNHVAILSGANTNFDSLRFISERAEIGEQREAVFALRLAEEPGSFRRFCQALSCHAITEFNYRYSDSQAAWIYVGVTVRHLEDARQLHQSLNDKKFETHDLTTNDIAKLHVRHMIGGKINGQNKEVVYLFHFPERLGALSVFLDKLGDRWNISMFHYRNHGADFGRVLCGFQLEKGSDSELIAFLKDLGYVYEEVTHNEAYKIFLTHN